MEENIDKEGGKLVNITKQNAILTCDPRVRRQQMKLFFGLVLPRGR